MNTATTRSPLRGGKPASPTTSVLRRFMVILGFLAALGTAAPAMGAGLEPGSQRARRVGTALVATTTAVQLGGLVVGIATTVEWAIPRLYKSAWLVNSFYSPISIAFAPLGIAGLRLLLDDGAPGSRDRGLGAGLLVGALYSGIRSALPGHDLVGLVHGILAGGMLVPGIILMARGTKRQRSQARAEAPLLLPRFGPGGAGLLLVGRFP